MTILKQLQTDMRKLQTDYQRKLVVEALRNRAQELTLGDIRKILSSPLGADLGDLLDVAGDVQQVLAGSARLHLERARALGLQLPLQRRDPRIDQRIRQYLNGRQLTAIARAAEQSGAAPWVMAPMIATPAEAAEFAEQVGSRVVVTSHGPTHEHKRETR